MNPIFQIFLKILSQFLKVIKSLKKILKYVKSCVRKEQFSLNRREEIDKILVDIDSNQRTLVDPLIDEVIFLEEQMKELRKLPFIRIHPHDNTKQETTKAAKQYKELSQSYMNAIRILCSLLHKVEGEEEDPVQKFLEGRL